MSSTGAFQYWQRTMVHAGPGTVLRLPGLFSGLGSSKVLLVSDQGLKDAGVVDRVAALFVYSLIRRRTPSPAVSMTAWQWLGPAEQTVCWPWAAAVS